MRVIVVGAGVLGASVARHLAVGGAEVHLVDRWSPGGGTSATTFSWTNANRKPDPDHFRLNTAGMAEHVALARQLPGPPAYVGSGSLFLADAASEPWLAENVERLRGSGYEARFVDAEEAVRTAGDLRVPSSVTSIAAFPGEGYVLPHRLVDNLVADATRRGATVSTGEVERIEEADGVTVSLRDGAVLRGDRLVLAAGRWSEDLAATAGLSLPVVTDTGRGSPIIGLLGYVRSPQLDLRCVVHSPRLNLRPDTGGQAVVQALDLNPTVDPAAPVPPDDVEVVAQRFAELTASQPDVDISFRVGYRSLPADGLPVAGFASPLARVYALVAHSGITLAPLLGRSAAEELLADREEPMLRSFRPGRFAGTTKSEIAMERPTRLGEQ